LNDISIAEIIEDFAVKIKCGAIAWL